MRFLRCLRLDSSDLYALPRAAEPGEWAVAGSFAFAGRDLEALAGKDADVETCVFQGGHDWTEDFFQAAGRFLERVRNGARR